MPAHCSHAASLSRFLIRMTFGCRASSRRSCVCLQSFRTPTQSSPTVRTFLTARPDGETRFAQNGLLHATNGRTLFVEDCAWLWTNSMNTAHTCGITVRRKVLAELGRRLFAEDLSCCEDWEFQLRLYHLGQVVVLPEVYSWVRRFDDGTRLGRSIPGQSPTREQEITLLRSRLAVIERSETWLQGLRADLAAEFERFRIETESGFPSLNNES